MSVTCMEIPPNTFHRGIWNPTWCWHYHFAGKHHTSCTWTQQTQGVFSSDPRNAPSLVTHQLRLLQDSHGLSLVPSHWSGWQAGAFPNKIDLGEGALSLVQPSYLLVFNKHAFADIYRLSIHMSNPGSFNLMLSCLHICQFAGCIMRDDGAPQLTMVSSASWDRSSCTQNQCANSITRH